MPDNKSGRVYFIDASGGRLLAIRPESTDLKVPIAGRHRLPDGIVVDKDVGHIYWTEMDGSSAEDGSLEKADIEDSNRVPMVPKGKTCTTKQLQLNKRNGKLYWCDREGMRVMRSNLDGSDIETLVQTGQGATERMDSTRWCVGIAMGVEAGKALFDTKGCG